MTVVQLTFTVSIPIERFKCPKGTTPEKLLKQELELYEKEQKRNKLCHVINLLTDYEYKVSGELIADDEVH